MRKIISLLIGLCPSNVIRIFLYRTLLGYKIAYSSKIGWLNLIDCHECEIGMGGGGGGQNRNAEPKKKKKILY
jgi:hypothetical protein